MGIQCLHLLLKLITYFKLRSFLLKIFALFPPFPPRYIFRKPENQQYRDNSFSVQDPKIIKSCPEEDIKYSDSQIVKKKLSYQTCNDTFHLKNLINYHQLYYCPKNYDKYPVHDVKLINISKELVNLDPMDDVNISGYILNTYDDNLISSIFVEFTSYKSNKLIIYSHSNSTDIGCLIENFVDLALNLEMNVLGYEYSGYGQSTGKLDDLNMIFDIFSAYQFAVKELGFKKENIILYGYSIGSGPSISLAAHQSIIVGALILIAPLSSGLKALQKQQRNTVLSYDIFPNDYLIQNVSCPILILHGTKDKVLPLHHSILLKQNAKSKLELKMIEGGGHNNIETHEEFRIEFISTLQRFTKRLERNMNKNQEFDFGRVRYYQKFYERQWRKSEIELELSLE